jgi:2-octaprenyl-6-methoxyphenol hydroxylase
MGIDYDVLIVGGGMVGASLGVALAPTGLHVGVVEARPYGSPGQPSYDDRSIALSYGSRLILSELGLWEGLRSEVTPIRAVHVSERGRFGATRLHCEEEGVPALGYVVENRSVGRMLSAALDDGVLIAPATVESLEFAADHVMVHLGSDGESRSVTTRLLVAADGTHSRIREQLGIPARTRDYRQAAVIANVTPGRPHRNVAYERFTDSGPLALLPMSESRCSLVWTHRAEDLTQIESLSDGAFLSELQRRFGHRLGPFVRVGRRHSYPLVLLRACRDTAERAVLIGNASHTLHPVAGQGFNLALRDVAVLADLLSTVERAGADPGEAAVLEAYARARRGDLRTVERYTDALARAFVVHSSLIGHLRGAGLVLLDMLTPARHALARQSMGLRLRRPQPGRGAASIESGP